jgi:hypothetical protein
MNSMKKPILNAFAIIVLILVNCSGPKTINELKDQTACQDLNLPESGEDTLKASFFADTVIYLPLETSKESFIGFIPQVWMNDSVIIINDSNARLLMFRKNGKFKQQIGKNGRGPGEYVSILHFDVIRDTIYISSAGRRSLLRYTFSGGFCDELKFNYQPAVFSSTFDQKLACYDQFEGKIYVYGNKNYTHPDTITVEYGITQGRYRYTQMPLAGYCHLQKTTTGLLFNSFLSDTIWNINRDTKEPAFTLNLKDKLLPYDRQIEFSNGDFETFNQNANHYSFVHLIPFPSLTFIFQFHHTIYADDSGYDAIYFVDNKTQEIKKYNTSYIYDDIVSKQKLSYERFAFFLPVLSAEYLVTFKKPLDILKNPAQNKGKALPSSQWLNQMESIKAADNPILVRVRLKK